MREIYIQPAIIQQKMITPAAASNLKFVILQRGTTHGTACSSKDDCYDGDCPEPLVNCDDAEDGEFCGCGFFADTAECCENTRECEVSRWWGKAYYKECHSYCKDLEEEWD